MPDVFTGDVVLVLTTFEADALATIVQQGIASLDWDTPEWMDDLTERQANICARILHDMGYRKM